MGLPWALADDSGKIRVISATVLLVLSDRGSLRVVKGCSRHASLLAASHVRTNT